MKQYLDLVRNVYEHGFDRDNRTASPARYLPSATLTFDLRERFPILSTRQVPVQSSIREMIGFLRGFRSAAQFRDIGCNFWDKNANDPDEGRNAWVKSPHRLGEDDLGEIYGVNWREWPGYSGKKIDQVRWVLDKIMTDPCNNRLIVEGWNVGAIHEGRMALPPCHKHWQIVIDQNEQCMHMVMAQRSCDLILGIGGGNITGYAFLLHTIAKLTSYKVGTLTMQLANPHIYHSHFGDNLNTLLSREPLDYKASITMDFDPKLIYDHSTGFLNFDRLNPDCITVDYKHQGKLQFDMVT